jgi:histidyl-tRNA synthetase
MAVHLAKGVRDHLPAAMHRRLQVFETVREVFTRYGFEPLETPAFERIETLTGKYGDEGEKLMFRILKRGAGGQRGEVDLALRYDLTVPLARVVAMHPELRLPFKRWQMQPVWRADRPQRGRFREFYQCDVDTIGSTSMAADAECIAVVHDSLVALGFTDFTVRLNHRALLRAMVEHVGVADQEHGVLVAVDKLDKIGREGVSKELADRGIAQEAIDGLWGLLAHQGAEALAHLRVALGDAGRGALDQVAEVLAHASDLGVDPARVRFDPTLARGLDYYTGPVFEAVVTEPKIGSIGGGGRYDGLIGMFGKQAVPAVGVSLGVERILVVMEELGMLPEVQTLTRVYVTVFNDASLGASQRAATAFRAAGIPSQVALKGGKLGRQFKHAGALGIPWVVVVGEREAAAGVVKLKDMKTGEQVELSLADAVAQVQGS